MQKKVKQEKKKKKKLLHNIRIFNEPCLSVFHFKSTMFLMAYRLYGSRFVPLLLEVAKSNLISISHFQPRTNERF